MPDNLLVLDLKKGECTIQVKNKVFIKAGQSDNLTVADKKGVLANSTQGKLSADCKNIELTGNSGVSIESKASFEAKGSTIDVKAQGPCNVKGGILNLN